MKCVLSFKCFGVDQLIYVQSKRNKRGIEEIQKLYLKPWCQIWILLLSDLYSSRFTNQIDKSSMKMYVLKYDHVSCAFCTLNILRSRGLFDHITLAYTLYKRIPSVKPKFLWKYLEYTIYQSVVLQRWRRILHWTWRILPSLCRVNFVLIETLTCVLPWCVWIMSCVCLILF